LLVERMTRVLLIGSWKEEIVTSQTEILASHVARGKFEGLPSDVISHAKHCIMDTVSCGLGGRKTPDADILIATMKEIGGTPEATIFGDRTKLSFIQAAHVNRLLANILDYDDAYMKVGHMTIVLVPVALALGERLRQCLPAAAPCGPEPGASA